MARPTKKPNFDEVTAMVSVLKAIGTQVKKTPFTKPQVVELTGLPTPQVTASYKMLLKNELVEQIDLPKGMPPKGVYLKIIAKGRAYCKAYDLLFA